MDNKELSSIKSMALNYVDPIRGKILGLIAELESLQRERDEWKDNANASIAAFNDLQGLVESLQRDKAALIEVLEKYAVYENLIKARLTPANDILSRMKGDTHA